MAITADDELAMFDAVSRQGTAMPGGLVTTPPGMVLVAAIVPHKHGPPNKGADRRVRYLPGQHYYMTVEQAEHAERRGIVYRVGSQYVDWYGAAGRILDPLGTPDEPLACAASPGSLKIVSGCGYDPGSQAYRFHSALNQSSKHASIFVRWGDSNPHCSLRQYDGEHHPAIVRQATLDADVLHCHVGYYMLNNTGLSRRPGQLLVRHYHGSMQSPTSTFVQGEIDVALGALVVGARLSFYRDAALVSKKLKTEFPIQWLPITVPVSRYQRLRSIDRNTRIPTADDPYLIAHAPTKRSYKGTTNFLKAVQRLRGKGLHVKHWLIEGAEHGRAMQLKAGCDATFDSFWLGIQTSGLEGAAMSQPVIAGDPDVADLHRQHVGYVPYTYANDELALEKAIERLVLDVEYRMTEAARVQKYTVQYHDYPAVARRYEEILAKRLNRTDVFTDPVSVAA